MTLQRAVQTACISVLIILSITGCASPKGKVVSKRDPSFEGQLQRVLVVYPDKDITSALGKPFANRFLNQLTNTLAHYNIQASSIELPKDSLDNDSLINAAAKQFRPGQLLGWGIAAMRTTSIVDQTLPGDIPRFRTDTSVTLEFNLADVWVNRNVWRARISYQAPPSPEAVANQLIEELVAAKLLVQQSPQQNR